MISIVTLHFSAVIFSLAVLVIADVQAFLWLIGKKEVLNARLIKALHILMWIGLLVTATLGASLAYPILSYLLVHPPFLLKMMFVGTLITNAFLIGAHYTIATERSFASLSSKERIPLFVSGALSTLGWVGAFVIGWFFL